jgi:hypothetical protein
MGLPDIIDPEEDLGLPYTNHSEIADPETDMDAGYMETLCVTVAGLSHTTPRAVVVVSGAAGATTALLLLTHFAVWGDTDAVKPTCTRTATGVYTIAWASSYVDLNPTTARAVTAATNLRTCFPTIHGTGSVYATLTGNTVTVTTKTGAAAAATSSA